MDKGIVLYAYIPTGTKQYKILLMEYLVSLKI